MKKIMEFFGFTSAGAFMKEWKALTETDQAQLKAASESERALTVAQNLKGLLGL
ncbi:hypothetical protein PBI_GABRIELA_51 [Mycobacterium phage Gabriela]|nr:hypothetical protein PBI_GABRIELA_51 [Mycobacterium phage Gabriela]